MPDDKTPMKLLRIAAQPLGKAADDTCGFCSGNLEKPTKEHVLPQWLLKERGLASIEIEPTHVANDGTPLSSRRHKLASLVLGSVCATCNGGWMSALEVSAAGPLRTLINGASPAALSLDEREFVGRWALKTVAALNWASNYPAMVSRAEAASANPSSRLADGIYVFGATHTPSQAFCWLQGPAWTLDEGVAPIEEIRRWHKTSLSIGAMILTVAFVPPPNIPVAISALHYGLAASQRRVAWSQQSIGFAGKTTPEVLHLAHLGLSALAPEQLFKGSR